MIFLCVDTLYVVRTTRQQPKLGAVQPCCDRKGVSFQNEDFGRIFRFQNVQLFTEQALKNQIAILDSVGVKKGGVIGTREFALFLTKGGKNIQVISIDPRDCFQNLPDR